MLLQHDTEWEMVILMNFSSLAALGIIISTTSESGAANDENFSKTATFSFQWIIKFLPFACMIFVAFYISKYPKVKYDFLMHTYIIWNPACPIQYMFNSFRSSDTIWWQRSGAALAQVMACYLMAPSHCLNQCWVIISMSHGIHLWAVSLERAKISVFDMPLKITTISRISNGPKI